MSSKQAHIDIHAGNYEGYFILYLDRELNETDSKIVEDFLSSHPELEHEFKLLSGTKLPLETFSFNKEVLMAAHRLPGSFTEDLLLYLDNELPPDRKKILELELSSHQELDHQFKVLLQTKLSADDTVSHPHKNELMRKGEKAFGFPTWVRIAAIFLLISLSGLLYFIQPGRVSFTSGKSLSHTSAPSVTDYQPVSPFATPLKGTDRITVSKGNHPSTMASRKGNSLKTKSVYSHYKINDRDRKTEIVIHESLNARKAEIQNTSSDIKNPVRSLPLPQVVVVGVSPPVSNESINSLPVTSVSTDRITNDIASNNKKGSVKGFLRKASRLIERRTGFDPRNDNGDLLIGVVAVKLK